MAESYAGITVPEGEPETIREPSRPSPASPAASTARAPTCGPYPGLVADWKGPASAAFGGTVITNGSAVDTAPRP